MTELTKEHMEILKHTKYRAANKAYCGTSPEMKDLCQVGYMKSIGGVSWAPDEYFTITDEGMRFLESVEVKMTEPIKEQDSIFQKIEWASNTHKEKLMFGLDELGASIVREHRLHGVLMSAKNELTRKDKEIKTLKEQLAAEIKQREKAENILKVSADINLSGWETYRMANQYFAEKEKQDKENKDKK